MRLSALLSFFLSLLVWRASTVSGTSDGNTTLVTWDEYSLSVRGERVFIFSGEFHYHRLPVPEMWLDVLQKLKANGYNAVSVYFLWNYHSASEGVFDFETGAHDIQRFFDYAKQAGVYIIARPGPYINGETTAGGFALWAANGKLGDARTSDETYHQAWLPWILEVAKILKANQITEGGPVILHQNENELQETVHSADNTLVLYMEQIIAAYAEAGIVVPSSSNEKGMRSMSWSTDYEDVGGAVNVYGLDSYPGGLSCTDVDTGFEVLHTYYEWFQNYSYTQPEYFPEFEGGWFEAWGGSFYDTCTSELSPQFADVFYKNNLGQRVTMQSLYMSFGGTNWGHFPAPVVYTSYDYSAPLRETRQIRDKLRQIKLIGLFTRVSADLRKTVMEGNGTTYTNSSSIWTWVIRNPDTQARFYVTQQADTSTFDSVKFDLNVTTSAGAVTLSDINLDGRQSKIIVTDYTISSSTTLLFSSAEVLTYANLDVDVIAFYLDVGQVGHFAFKDAANLTFTTYGSTSLTTAASSAHSTVYTYTQGTGVTAVKFSNGLVAYLLDRDSAWYFWAPPTTSDPNVKPDQHIFVQGPYLVRNASVEGSTVKLVGDNENTTTLEVFADSSIKTVEWNGNKVSVKKTAYGSLVGSAPGAEDVEVSLPTLDSWKAQDSIPEINPAYDDSLWPVCNHTTTLNPVAPLTLPVLYSPDYGYHAGIKVYRGRFDGPTTTAANITGANVTVQNGYAAGWSAWLNGEYVGGSLGGTADVSSTAVLPFNSSSLKATDNLLTLLLDYTGHDEDDVSPAGTQNPRGILGASLITENNGSITPPNFTSWRIRGNAGGEANIDPVRGPLNEGGLYAERMGWHLPGYPVPTTDSSTDSPLDGVAGAAGRFYLTNFTLDLPADLDVPLGLQLGSPADTAAVVHIYMNGYQFGHYLPHYGPQEVFPFPPGIINNRGLNTLGINLWSLTDAGAALDTVQLISYGKYRSGFDFNSDWSYLQPAWKNDREKYA
ncbi:hypothetical protein ASPZODRAFT_68401 [Penicilliopsis zonata CBS 506.65]|uniref:beta-galactosidase n=1 Tax=Penicilliopsis zonata CBS 506.65 TaxID=1073090 RepID=A0A1L9SF93_9EURO|nr:hypothetical protein ASPZODRAFT_68401 [Penicilliopsis zonata CBS 506.65]OJJ45757.1 hypothetical protein ASPZODRAFT_68401 [Penicilliopsis zonata CBS 506.65]